MSLEHKAFAFDYAGFTQKLGARLQEALTTGEQAGLEKFIEKNLGSLRDPNEGEPLGPDWRESLETVDAHQLGDIALTMFYDPAHDIGLGYEWERLQSVLDRDLHPYSGVLLGEPFGPAKHPFDPGKMGSFFQSQNKVLHSLQLLETLAERPELSALLSAPIRMLKQALKNSNGLYVTF